MKKLFILALVVLISCFTTQAKSSTVMGTCRPLVGQVAPSQLTGKVKTPGCVSVSPDPVTITTPGATQQFTATGGTVIWSVTGAGKIDQNGLYTAPAASSNDTVSACVGSICGTASVMVTIPVTIAVAPTAAPVIAGRTLQLTATVSGSATPVVWAVSGKGTITQTGMFTAPAATETDVVTACIGTAPCASANLTITNNFDGAAELPRVLIDSSVAATPTPGAQTQVAAGSNLQTALNNANCGDVLNLAAGATWNGKFTLPAKSCDDAHYIQIRTSTPDIQLPPEGTRIQPCYFGVASLPGRPTFMNCPGTGTANLGAKINYNSKGGSGPLFIAAGANHYRIGPGIEITRSTGTGIVYSLISPGPGANHIVFDRIWLHGVAQEETNNGFGTDGMNYAALVDSYTSDFHCTSNTGTCADSHVVGGGTSSLQEGPFKIHDNFIESAGEGVLFGGGPAQFTPADIEITGNHFFKPLTWLVGQPGYVGGTVVVGKCPNTGGSCPFVVKNNLEFKNAQRVLVEGNIFENVWGGYTQVGFQVLLTPKSQAGANGSNQCPKCMVQDITIRYCKLSHSGSGIALANAPSDNGGWAAAGRRWTVHDITIDDVQAVKYNGTGGNLQIVSAGLEILDGLTIDHITAFPDTTGYCCGKNISMGGASVVGSTMTNFQYTNSILGSSKYPVWSTGGTTNCANSNIPLTTFNTCAPNSYKFTNNALIQPTRPAAQWPPSNFFPTSVTMVGFVNFNNGNGGDYHLVANSPYKNAGTDGKDLGANIDAIDQATANAN